MTNRREKAVILAIAFAFSFLLYSNSINGDFVSDDKLVILQNPLINGNFGNLSRAFATPYYYGQPHAGLYRPFTVASYALNRIFSAGPLGFHLVNIILNALNGFLVFLLAFKLLSRSSPNFPTFDVGKFGERKLSFLAMLFFMFLPIHSEAVSAIVGRAELLAFFFSALSLLFVLNKKYAWASVFILPGLLSKETAAGFFLVFLYLWKFRENKSLRQIFRDSLYFIPSVAAYVILRAYVLGKYLFNVDHLMAYNPLRFAPFFQSLWTSLKVFYLYLLKTAAPHNLSSDYSFNQIPIIKSPFLSYEVWLGAVILAVMLFLAVKKRNSLYGLSAAIFLLTYFLVSNWVIKIGTIMGERLMYAPSLGLAILAALPASHLLSVGRKIIRDFVCAGLVVVFFLYGWAIIERNRDWINETSLLTSGYAASPNSVVSLTNMAYLEFDKKNYRKASEWAEKAIAILPDHMPAIFLAGHAYKNSGDSKKAELYWLKVIGLSPSYVSAYLSLGVLYYEQGRLEEAEEILGEGFKIEKTWGKLFPLALVKINLGKYDEAIQMIVGHFGENPEKRELKFALGLAYLKQGDNKKAGFYLNQVKDPGISTEDFFKKVINQKVFKISEY